MDFVGVEVGVGELVALINQTFDYAYPEVTVTGELANLRVSKGKWLYFDLKDESASVKFFGTVYMLPGPLEDGMLVRVVATPRLHNLYGFSMNVRSIQPAGEGSIKKAAQLLEAKLTAEGLFDPLRKRTLPAVPTSIGLITSKQSAAYADFIKILNARFGGLNIHLIDVQVQGEPAPRQIVAAIEQCNALAEPPEVLVLIRGGGSAEDLAAFSTEQVARAVAASRVPTLVAIGHEVDVGLAELAADLRASTPSNAAEMLVPDKQSLLGGLSVIRARLDQLLGTQVSTRHERLHESAKQLEAALQSITDQSRDILQMRARLIEAYDPLAPLQRGYAVVRREGSVIGMAESVKAGDSLRINFKDGDVAAKAE